MCRRLISIAAAAVAAAEAASGKAGLRVQVRVGHLRPGGHSA